MRVTDAFGNRLPGRRSACWRTTAQRSPRRHHAAGRYGGDLCYQPDGGSRAVTATINSSTQSQNVTFIAMSGRRRSRIWWSLRMVQRRTFDGEHAAGEGDRCVRQCTCRQAVSVMAGNSATVTPTVTTSRTVRWSSVSPARRQEPVQSRQYQQQQPEPGRDIYRRCQPAQIASLEVTQDNSVADGAMRTRCGRGSRMRSVMHLPGRRQRDGRQWRNCRSDGHHATGRTVEISVTSQTAGTSTVTASSTAAA